MRVDFRTLCSRFGACATLLGALGLNSAAHAQSLDAFANIKNPKFVDQSWPKPLLTRWPS
jgi:hypothetical protein